MDAVHSTRTLQACKPFPRPFAALPHDVAADPRLAPTDVAVLLALTFWARARDHCWPSDRSIGHRIGRGPATVQRRLRRLESLGLVERIKTDANRTGRVIRLLWRTSDDRPPRSRMTDPPRSPVTDEGRRSVKGESSNPEKSESVQRPRPEPAAEPTPVKAVAKVDPRGPEGPPAPRETASRGGLVPIPVVEPAPAPPPTPAKGPTRPVEASPTVPDGFHVRPRLRSVARISRDVAAVREQTSAWAASDDPILRAEAERRLKPKAPPKLAPTTTAELLARLREDPAFVPQAAELLAQTFDDRKSWSGFHAVAKRAFEGELEPDALVHALARATDGKARNPGAVFMTVVNRRPR